MWTHEDIAHEVGLYAKLHKAWFPLPQLIEHHVEKDSISWMKEEVVQWELYSDLFRESTQKSGSISDELFSQYLDYQLAHFHAQANFDHSSLDIGSFPSYEYLYEEQVVETGLLDAVITKIDTVLSWLPMVWNHGDHNPYNIFTQGIIDLLTT